MPDMPNKVRQYREKQGITLEQLAHKSGLSTSQISKIERGKRGWSMASMEQLSSALGIRFGELFDDPDAWQNAPVFGLVGAGGTVIPLAKKTRAAHEAPKAFGPLIVLVVEDDSLYPRYLNGDAVFCTGERRDAKLCLNRECLVVTDKGHMLRTVHPGSTPNHFNLLAYNAAPKLDQKVNGCHPVVYIAPLLSG